MALSPSAGQAPQSSSLSSSSSSSNVRTGEAHRLDDDDEHEKREIWPLVLVKE